MSEWLDLELSHHLAPVEAPPELWARIHSGRRFSRQSAPPLFAVPVAAVVTLVLAGALYFVTRTHTTPSPYRSNNPVADCMRCHT
jgi:hypothetical protein